MSFTGCNQQASAEPFYYDVASQRTYQECFGDLELSPSTPLPAEEINAVYAAADGVVLCTDPGTLARAYAINALGQKEGAYQIDVNTGVGVPQYVYCTGRGTVQADLTCNKSPCETTANYIVFGAKSVGNFCYHTCYAHASD